MSELKPCPFCGKRPELELTYNNYPFTHTSIYYTVTCKKCGYSLGHYDIPRLPEYCRKEEQEAKESAIEAWNRRVES